MPDPALEAAHQLFAARLGVARLEQAGDLLAQRLGFRPQLFGLGLDRAAQGLEHLPLDPLGAEDGDGEAARPVGADRRHRRRGRWAGGEPRRSDQAGAGVAADLRRRERGGGGNGRRGHGQALRDGLLCNASGAPGFIKGSVIGRIFLKRGAAATPARVILRPALYISAMTVVIDHRRARRGIPKRPTGRTTISSASRTGSGSRRRCRREYAATREIVRDHKLHTVCEEAACPEYRRVLDQAPRHHDDHGRHLHPRLRLLQREDRPARRRWMPKSRPMSPRAVKNLGLTHVVITSVDRDDLADGGAAAFRRRDPRHPCGEPRHHAWKC